MSERRFVPFYIDIGHDADVVGVVLESSFAWTMRAILIRTISGNPWRKLTLMSGMSTCGFAPDSTGRIDIATSTGPFEFPITIHADAPQREMLEVIVIGECDAPPMPEGTVFALMHYIDKTHAKRLKQGSPK